MAGVIRAAVRRPRRERRRWQGDEHDNALPDLERISGSFLSDILIGADGPNQLFGGPGDDVLRGRGGHDELNGYDGNDTLDGGSGHDVCVQGLGTGAKISCESSVRGHGPSRPGCKV
jgi:hypothetical protein